MKAAVVIDRWKLPIFTRHLKEAGFSYEEVGGLTTDSLVLTVVIEPPKLPSDLQRTIVAATVECKRARP